MCHTQDRNQSHSSFAIHHRGRSRRGPRFFSYYLIFCCFCHSCLAPAPIVCCRHHLLFASVFTSCPLARPPLVLQQLCLLSNDAQPLPLNVPPLFCPMEPSLLYVSCLSASCCIASCHATSTSCPLKVQTPPLDAPPPPI